MPLFKTGLTGVDGYRLEFVPSADGKRILMSTPIKEESAPPAITVVLNWPALLEEIAAVGSTIVWCFSGGGRRAADGLKSYG